MITDDMVKMMVSETNLYSVQSTGSNVKTNELELKAFIGILLYMGVIQLPTIQDYWAADTRISIVADIMPRNRFQKLRRLLHFNNNEGLNETTDRLYKIRPFLEILRQNCLKIEEESQFSIDEMMAAYKGTRAGNLRQYIANKPPKWGFKLFVRAGVSGIVYDYFVYASKNTFQGTTFTDEEEKLGFGAKVVIHLCRTISPNIDAKCFFDNYFCSFELIDYLKEKGIRSLGTVRSSRLRGCPLPSDGELKKKERGTNAVRTDSAIGLTVVKWLDNKPVTLASSFVSVEPKSKVKRYSKELKTKVDVVCPKIVEEYNTHMGGVDLADMLIALYKTPSKS